MYGFNFGWWTVGYKVQNDAFRLFDVKLAGADQLSKKTFPTQQASIQYSRYNWSTMANQTYLWLIGAAFSYGNNLSALTKTEITDITNYSTVPNQRTSTEKYNVYTGSYESRLKGLRIYADGYWFLFKDNFFAIHGYPEIQLRDTYRPTYNFGMGTLFSFKDAKGESANVNVELYYNFRDLFDYTDTPDKFLNAMISACVSPFLLNLKTTNNGQTKKNQRRTS